MAGWRSTCCCGSSGRAVASTVPARAQAVVARSAGEVVEVAAVGDDLAVEFGQRAVGGLEHLLQVGSSGPEPDGEPDEVAGGEVVAGVLEVDESKRSLVAVYEIARSEVEVAGYCRDGGRVRVARPGGRRSRRVDEWGLGPGRRPARPCRVRGAGWLCRAGFGVVRRRGGREGWLRPGGGRCIRPPGRGRGRRVAGRAVP